MDEHMITGLDSIYMKDDEGRIVCEITFKRISDKIYNIDHTFVDDSLRGRGIAAKLAEAAVNEIIKRGGVPVATCSYAAQWLKEHGMG